MLENSRLSLSNLVTLVDHDFLLSIFVVVNPVVVYIITFINEMLMNAHSIPAEPVPCPEPYIGESSFE